MNFGEEIDRFLAQSEALREQTRQAAKRAAIRCLGKAWEALFKEDWAGVAKWTAQAEEMAKIVKEG
jgi:hypothetical protein